MSRSPFLAAALTALTAAFVATLSAQRADPAIGWLKQAAAAIGGEARLRSLSAVEISGVSVVHHREQSERPEGPWIPTFAEFTDVRHFASGATLRTSRTRGFVEQDTTAWTPDPALLVVDDLAFARNAGQLAPAQPPWDLGTVPLALGPERVLLTALDARDVHAEPDVQFHGYAHHVVAFSAAGARVRVLLTPPSLLPKAVEITRARPFDMFWAPWGDVTARLTFGIWNLEPSGLRYPRVWEYSTADQPDGTVDITSVRVDPTVAAADVTVSGDLHAAAIADRRRTADVPLGSAQRPARELAPGIVKVPASFDVLEVRQNDGVLIVEGPLASGYSEKVIADARTRFGGAAIAGVITTSDAWPHIGGMREYVARGVPIYAMSLNVPILQRLFAAPYVTDPDALARSARAADIRAVSGKASIGSGANRIELYPILGATTERQMLAYFPERQLLYTSDAFTIRKEMVFLPQMVSEVVDAVAREHLDVTTAVGMHYDALPWSAVVAAASPPKVK
jgi:hypothetical protein